MKRDSSRPDWLIGLAAVVWLAVVLVGYYFIHKPIRPEQAVALARSGIAIAAWLATLVWAAALGRALAPWLSAIPARERLALQMGLGLGALGLIVLALGAVSGYRAWIPAAVLLVGGLGLRSYFRPVAADLRAAVVFWPKRSADRAMAIYLCVILGLAFLRALAPPTAYDELVYHLTGPKAYLAAGRLHHDLDIPHLGFPQWPAMLFTWAMLLGGPSAAHLLHWTFAVLTLALVPGLVRIHAPGRGWLAGALSLSAPTGILLAGWAYAEWFAMFAVTAAVWSLVHWQREERTRDRWLALAGVCAGLSLAAKYTAAGALAGLCLLVVPWSGRENRARAGLIFGAAVLSVVIPYALKNWLLTGNPAYPFFFSGKFWDGYRALWYGQPGTGLRGLALLAAPWAATVWGVEGGGPYGADIGPLFLGLLPFVFFGWRRWAADSRRPLVGMAIVVLIAYVAWIAQLAWSRLLAQTRLLLPVFPLLAVLAAVAFDNLGLVSTRFAARWMAGAIVALVLALTAAREILTFAANSPLPVITGAQTKGDYLAEQLGMHYYAMLAVNELPARPRVVFLWEPRSFYCERECLPDATLDRWWHLRRTVGEEHAIAQRWRAEGITHVLIYQVGADAMQAEGLDPYEPDDWSALQRLRRDELSLVLDLSGVYQVYALAP